MGQNEIERYAGAILNDPRFQKLRSFEHHGPANTVYDHSLAVTRAAYRIACALHLSEEETASVVRAALLHDFFGYDWHSERFRRFVRHYSGFRRLTHMHGFIHGHIAAARAKRVFGLLRPANATPSRGYVPPRAHSALAHCVDRYSLGDRLCARRSDACRMATTSPSRITEFSHEKSHSGVSELHREWDFFYLLGLLFSVSAHFCCTFFRFRK